MDEQAEKYKKMKILGISFSEKADAYALMAIREKIKKAGAWRRKEKVKP